MIVSLSLQIFYQKKKENQPVTSLKKKKSYYGKETKAQLHQIKGKNRSILEFHTVSIRCHQSLNNSLGI